MKYDLNACDAQSQALQETKIFALRLRVFAWELSYGV